jgi:uncharacterized membrane protein YeaQ/YmgE (transglycosylase-associated protein family)
MAAMVNLLGWLVCGLLIGWAAHHLTRASRNGTLLVYLVGCVMGAVLGGFGALIFEARPLHELSVAGLIAAMLGAFLVVALVRLLMRRLM